MPTVRKKFMASKQRARNPKELTERRYTNLTSWMDVILNGDMFKTLEDRRICYEANRDEILQRWLSNPANYCTRPYCYHQFEELPPREIVGREKWWNPIGQPGRWEISPIEEAEFEWLHRLGLLEGKEVKRYHELKQEAENGRERLRTLGSLLPADTTTTNHTEVKEFV